MVGHYLFRYGITGYESFSSVSEANYNMLILMTTANFPDVMLPAYNEQFWVILFFCSFLCVGLYFLMNFLLANVFNKFKDRLERNYEKIMVKTEVFLIEIFDSYDNKNSRYKKGYLTWQEAKEFFSNIFSLNLRRKKHYE